MQGIQIREDGSNIVAHLPLGTSQSAGALEALLPRQVIYRNARAVALRNAALTFSGLLLVLGTLWWFGYRLILKPTQSVLRTITRLADGDLDARASFERQRSETGKIARALNRMAMQLDIREKERKQHLASLERINRLLRVQKSLNKAIAQRLDAQALMREICRILHSEGKFTASWIGEVEPAAHAIRAVCWAGPSDLYPGDPGDICFPLDPNATGGLGPTAKVAREGVMAVHNHYPDGLTLTAWQAAWQRHGIRSVLAIPIGTNPTGARRILALGHQDEAYFEAEEIRILEDIAESAAHGISLVAAEAATALARTVDPLTGLTNALFLEQRLRDELDRARANDHHVVLAVLDVHYARMVSRLGLKAANALMQKMGEEIRHFMGSQAIVGSLPGERFAIARSADSIEDACRPIELLTDRIRAIVTEETKGFFVSDPAIGIAIFPDDAEEPDTLLERSGQALESHPASLHGLRFYTRELGLQLETRRKLEHDLGHAIERNQLQLHFQPIVDTMSGMAKGFEALLRWNHPSLGMVPPDQFIPLAESSGLIHSIGKWVMAEAARQAGSWEQRGTKDIFIALNVSAVQIEDPALVEHLEQIMHHHQGRLESIRLALEITENHLMEDVAATSRLINRLKSHGMESLAHMPIVLDDFGTAYSSLSYLHQLPIDMLKIDKSFIKDIDHDPRARKIAKGILGMTHSLGLETVAEGIEREDQLAVIRKLHCTYAQGFLFARALPAARAEREWLGITD